MSNELRIIKNLLQVIEQGSFTISGGDVVVVGSVINEGIEFAKQANAAHELTDASEDE